MALASSNTLIPFLSIVSIEVLAGGSAGPALRLEKEYEDGGTKAVS